MELSINPHSFNLIESGHKTIETRLGNDPVLSRVKVGDELVFVNRANGQSLTRRVAHLQHYDSSDEVVTYEPLQKLGSYASAEEYLAKMQEFQTAEDEERHGVIAVHFIIA